MADDVDVTPGSGKTVRSEEIGGKQYQQVIVGWGPAGTFNKTDTATGKPLPMQLRSATGLIPIGEPTDNRSTNTDTTSTTLVSIFKQISFSIQAAAASLASLVTAIGSTAWDLGAGAIGSRTQRVAIASDSSGVITTGTRGAHSTQYVSVQAAFSDTGTDSNVNDSAASVTILAANSARIGAAVYNDSTSVLYLLLGSDTPTSTLFTVKMQPDDYYEVPEHYKGIIKGIWASDASGAARVTEWT